MLADSLLPTIFWAEAVNIACYVLNRVLVTKPHNKTPYEVIIGRAPSISFMKPFGCPVTILNTLDPLGKFDGKAEEGFLVGYSVHSKAFRVFNTETRKVEENLHVKFLENKPNVAGQGPNWLFDIDSLTNSMNYQPVSAGNQTNKSAGQQDTNGSSKDGDGNTSFQWSQFTTQCSHLILPSFGEPEFPNKVYKVEKALYGLHQAPRAWYETLSTYLLENGFHRGRIDKTLFIKRLKDDIQLVQVYVDDIIFGSTKKSLCDDFEQIMHSRFQMSSMGELTFFLGLQVKQKENGIFISQDKYVGEILKKYDLLSIRSASTPMETQKALTKDEDGEDVDVHLYRSMIGSLMYLTSSRPDIMFSLCACSRFQVQPQVSHLYAVKRIFRYLKGQPKLGLWYPKDSPLILEAFSDSDYAGASLDRKSTTGGCQFIGSRLISWQCKKQTVVANSTTEAEYITKIHVDNESAICVVKNPVYHSKIKHTEIRHHFIRDSYEKRLIEMVKIHTDQNVADLLTKAFDVSRFNFLVASIADETVHKELGDRMERAATTTSSFEAEQDSVVQTRFETISKKSNDPPLSRVNTLKSGEDSMKLPELIGICT
ncbi:putative ribonuclease H-like domain-containing protein [Tanacetum coccineum]